MKIPKIPIGKMHIKIPSKVTNFCINIATKVKGKSPEICLFIGLTAGGAAIILTGVNTWKNKDIIKEKSEHIKYLKEYDPKIEEEHPDTPIMTEEGINQELHKAYCDISKSIFKAYWLPGVLTIGSFAFILGGHHLLRKELTAMTTAYALLLDSYNKYRERLIEDLGIEKDQEYMHGIKMIEAVDEKTGETYLKAISNENDGISRYARWFDEGDFDSEKSKWIWRNTHWCQKKSDNIHAVKLIQSSLNDTLHIRGWMKLNEAYMAFGLPCTEDGEHVGWVLGSGHDDCIDVGVFPNYMNGRHQLPVNTLFLDERNPQNSCLLDFNVDGCIDYIFKDIMEYDIRSYIAHEKRDKD